MTYTHSMGVLTSGGGLRDYHDPSICAVQLLRQCLLRFGVTRIPPYILPCVVLRAPIANKQPQCQIQSLQIWQIAIIPYSGLSAFLPRPLARRRGPCRAAHYTVAAPAEPR